MLAIALLLACRNVTPIAPAQPVETMATEAPTQTATPEPTKTTQQIVCDYGESTDAPDFGKYEITVASASSNADSITCDPPNLSLGDVRMIPNAVIMAELKAHDLCQSLVVGYRPESMYIGGVKVACDQLIGDYDPRLEIGVWNKTHTAALAPKAGKDYKLVNANGMGTLLLTETYQPVMWVENGTDVTYVDQSHVTYDGVTYVTSTARVYIALNDYSHGQCSEGYTRDGNWYTWFVMHDGDADVPYFDATNTQLGTVPAGTSLQLVEMDVTGGHFEVIVNGTNVYLDLITTTCRE